MDSLTKGDGASGERDRVCHGWAIGYHGGIGSIVWLFGIGTDWNPPTRLPRRMTGIAVISIFWLGTSAPALHSKRHRKARRRVLELGPSLAKRIVRCCHSLYGICRAKRVDLAVTWEVCEAWESPRPIRQASPISAMLLRLCTTD